MNQPVQDWINGYITFRKGKLALNAPSLIFHLGNRTDLYVIYNWFAFGKIYHYLNISNCFSVKIPVRTKAYICYNSVVPSILWQRGKWFFTYDKMELLKWKLYSGRTVIHTNEFKLYFKILFWLWLSRSWKMLPCLLITLLLIQKMSVGVEKVWLMLLSYPGQAQN